MSTRLEPTTIPTGNVALASRVQDCLSSLDGVPAHTIGSIVRLGSVTLSGEVEWSRQSETVASAVSCLEGVRTVDNRIRVATTSEHRSPAR